jgi:hypothetical protein
VRPDLREAALAEVGKPLIQLSRDGELEDTVAEELQALVRRRAVRRPGGMREDVVEALRRQRLDQLYEAISRSLFTGAR